MPGYNELLPVTSLPMTPDQLTAAMTNLARSIADMQSYRGIPQLQPASWLLPQSAVASATGLYVKIITFMISTKYHVILH